MRYKYLAKWIEENFEQNLVFKRIERFEDQIRILFRKQKKYFQINLASEDSFCFFSEKKLLPWEEAKEYSTLETHLSSARFTGMSISDKDRIIRLSFEKIDIYNQLQLYSLIIELIPRYQNIILVDKNEVIVDCKKKISYAENTHRQILPGVKYELPVAEYENKIEPIIYPIKLTNRVLVEAAADGFDSLNELLENLYYAEIFEKRNEQKKKQAITKVNAQIKKKNRKIEKLEAELGEAQKEEHWKQLAELLKGNFSQLRTGMDEIKVINYYQEDFPEIIIKLKPEYTAQKNINFYFKKYRKARDGKVAISKQISKTLKEVDELSKDIFEIEEQEIYLAEKQYQTRKRDSKRGFKKIVVDADWEILIGRTSTENDLITTKVAKSQDWWFHTRVFRGTHIVLRNYQKQELPGKLLLICCRMAAYYSKAKKSSNVPVDYTQIRYVRKPRGSVAGYVTYKNQKTLYVDPLSMRDAVQKINNWREV